MPDIIKILPDSVANQIAAGEVVQRPASVVKELLENSIDAGATNIKLIIRDSGKTLIQVTDNGSGMSETDARLCFERHATSKIKDAGDLFQIKSLGFRGEALASIAAIAQVELKSKKIHDNFGTSVLIEGSKIISHEVSECPDGTTISVRNIFFNVPARRNFLKSDQVETNHIIQEFQRVALAMPHIGFSFYNNGNELFHLRENSSLMQRIVAVFGKSYSEKIIPVEQKTDYVQISGFIGKPEFAKKNRNEQYFFVNNRFIRHSYLNFAISNAYLELIPASTFPSYFIFFDIDPKTIDINIHPTKTEIKFQDEKIIFAFLGSAVRRSIGKFNITPAIDFEQENSFDLPSSYKNKNAVPPEIKIKPGFNPFEKNKTDSNNKVLSSNFTNWQKLFDSSPTLENKSELIYENSNIDNQQILSPEWDTLTSFSAPKAVFLAKDRYIITTLKSGIIVIDCIYASERIYYENFLNIIEGSSSGIQQQLFPQRIELSLADAQFLSQITEEMKVLGFDISAFGANTFVVNGIPANAEVKNLQEMIENFIDDYRKGFGKFETDRKTNVARSMAKSISSRLTRQMSDDIMLGLIDKLFACKIPEFSPDGKKNFIIIPFEEIENKLK